jgi:uncharacterized membrane protein YdfJ with MMPL/SSD domain
LGARVVEARKALVAVGALAGVVVIALPIFGLRLGTSDASTDPAGSTTHQAYTALAQGFGPGFAVLVDALVIRSLLVPALMHLAGPANWALPGWLDRILPRLAIEARDEASATGPEAGLDPAKAL